MYKVRDNNVKNVFDALWHGRGNDAVSVLQVNVLVTTIWYPRNSAFEDEIVLFPQPLCTPAQLGERYGAWMSQWY